MSPDAFVSQACDVLEILSPDTVIERLTGEPLKSRLVAPDWLVEKQALLRAIEQELVRRDTRQGHYWEG